jgi:ankyrin repeat protein
MIASLLLLLPLVFAEPCSLSDYDVNTTALSLFDCDPPSDLFDRFLFVKKISLSSSNGCSSSTNRSSIRGVRPSRQLTYLSLRCVEGPVWSWIEASRDTLVEVDLDYFDDTDDTSERTLGDSLKRLRLEDQLSANSIDAARLLRSATSLESLSIDDVDLSGSLNFDFLTKLTSLALWDLPLLTGPLRLPLSVQSVSLYSMRLGTLPPFSGLTNLTSLSVLSAVSGTLPPLPTSLQSLTISSARLDGSLPPLQGLTNLTFLSVAAAGISGTLGPLPSSLTHLDLSNVRLSGTLPALQGLARLTHLEIGAAGFSGTLGPLPSSLAQLDLSDVPSLSGTLPALQGLTNLTHLEISKAGFSGTLGPLPSSLTQLDLFDVPSLSGTLPALESLAYLIILRISSTDVSGTLPKLPSLLISVDLSDNALTFVASDSFLHLFPLFTLSLSNNIIESVLPKLPPTVVRADFSDNLFFGSIPPGFCDNGSLLSDLRLDRNRLSGSATELSKCSSLARLLLQGNSFTGDPPFVRKSFASFCQLALGGSIVDGNQFSSCSDPTNECCDLEIDAAAIIVAGTAVACLLLSILWCCCVYQECRCKGGTARRNEAMRRLSWTELSAEELRHVRVELALMSTAQRASFFAGNDDVGWPFVSIACGRGYTSQVATMLDFGEDVHRMHDSRSLLHYAVGLGDTTMVEMLLRRGADPMFPSGRRDNALTLAATRDGMTEFLLAQVDDAALDLDCRTADFLTPVSIAQLHSQVDATVALFSAGASALPMSQSCVTVSRPLVNGWPTPDGATFTVVNGSLFAFCVDTTKKRPSVWQLDLQRMRTELIDEPIVWAEQGMRRGDDDDDASMSSADSMSSAASFSDDLDAIELGKVAPSKREPICARPGPRALVPDTKAPWISVGDDGLQLSCTAPRGWHTVVRSDLPIAPNATRNIGYFEVTIIDRGQLGDIYVGVSLLRPAKEKSSLSAELNRLLSLSVAHGCTRLDDNRDRPFCAPLLAGDVVGVGVNFATRDVFFTRNGEFLGTAYRVPDDAVILSNLRAGIGVRSFGECVRVNFGASPFAFDFRAARLTWKPVAVVKAGDRPLELGGGALQAFPLPSGDVMMVQVRDSPLAAASLFSLFTLQEANGCLTWVCKRLSLGQVGTPSMLAFQARFNRSLATLFVLAPDCGDGLLVWNTWSTKPEIGVFRLALDGDGVAFDGGWRMFEVAADSPLGAAPEVMKFSALVLGDFLVIVGGRRASLAVAKSAADLALATETLDDAARDALFVFDVKRWRWFGIDQFVDVDEQWMRTVVEIGMSPSHVVTTFADGRVGALIYGGTHVYDNSRDGSTVCLFLEEHGQQLRVTFERPHAVGASLPARSTSALGSGRFVSVDLPQTGDCAWAWREPIVQLGRYDSTLPSASLSELLVDCSFADVKLVCGDGKSFDVHAPVCRARLSGLCVLLGGGGKGGKAKRRVTAPANVSSQHMGWLLHYAYCDVMPSGAVSEEQIRAFLRECVVPLAPEHERRITELLVSARIKTPSRFASDMRAAFRVCDSAVDGDDDDDDDDDDLLSDVQLRLSDGRIVRAHRALLMAASGFFLTCFESELAPVGPVDMTGYDAALALAVVEFAYCGECAWDEIDVIELLLLARQLFVDALVDRCESLLIASVQQANEAWLREFAIAHGLARLAAACVV